MNTPLENTTPEWPIAPEVFESLTYADAVKKLESLDFTVIQPTDFKGRSAIIDSTSFKEFETGSWTHSVFTEFAASPGVHFADGCDAVRARYLLLLDTEVMLATLKPIDVIPGQIYGEPSRNLNLLKKVVERGIVVAPAIMAMHQKELTDELHTTSATLNYLLNNLVDLDLLAHNEIGVALANMRATLDNILSKPN